jgi:hypothetical protein
MTDLNDSRYSQREVVGVLPDAQALEAAVDALESAGFVRPAISVLCAGAQKPPSMDGLHRTAEQIADDPDAPREAFVSSDSRTEIKTLAIAVPGQIGAFAGLWASMATGGALAAALGAALLGGGVGVGAAALLVHAVSKHHARAMHDQLAEGGAIIWVATPDEDSERRAKQALEQSGANAIHAHTVRLAWGASAVPLHDAEPDPFLGRELPQQ